jgi:hypothetical protein
VIERPSLIRFALLSVVAALVTIGLKGGAYLLTGTAGRCAGVLRQSDRGHRGAPGAVGGLEAG